MNLVIITNYCKLQTAKSKSISIEIETEKEQEKEKEKEEKQENEDLSLLSLMCKDNENGNDVEQPPKKRRKIMPSISSNSNRNSNCNSTNFKNNTVAEWVLLMRKYFLKYFDFSLMKNDFFIKNVYDIPGLLLTNEKLEILEKRMRKDTSNNNASNNNNNNNKENCTLTLKDTTNMTLLNIVDHSILSQHKI